MQELLGFFLVANDETRRNVNSLIRKYPTLSPETRLTFSFVLSQLEHGFMENYQNM